MPAPCFMCGHEVAPMVHLYDVSRGFFAVGGEPRTCSLCSEKLQSMPDDQRAPLFSRFEVTQESPVRASNIIEDALVRGDEIRRRARS